MTDDVPDDWDDSSGEQTTVGEWRADLPPPQERCRAVAARTGEQCRAPRVPGFNYCHSHLGDDPTPIDDRLRPRD